MNIRFITRLLMDLCAASLLVAGLAYWWLDNTAHELIGLSLFLLVLAHNGLNRRWYGRLGGLARVPRGRALLMLNLALALSMIALVGSSIAVSRQVFAFLGLGAGTEARSIHILAAHWTLVLVGLHVGLNWRVVMARWRAFAPAVLTGRIAPVLRRIALLAIGVMGLHSAITMDVMAKLANLPTLDMWDFNARTPRFFANWLSIIGLCAMIGHFGARLLPDTNPRKTLA